jgi:anhydro-N-acetylmuramic acid kinase
MKVYHAIGLMSGTSLDGLDIAACEFVLNDDAWSYKIRFCQTYSYSAEWKTILAELPQYTALEFSRVNVQYGHLLGKLTRSFLDTTSFRPDFIASHGHTVFHQPDLGLTLQIGSGAAIAAETGIPVICDFRSLDVALGGQGAPLVPIGDRLLFNDFDSCLNLGGFANISFEKNGTRIAFDICPANIILNNLAQSVGQDYDMDGNLAKTGSIIPELLEKLNSLDFYKLSNPKSLGREWLEHSFLPVVLNFKEPVNNLLRTICEHIAIQVNLAVDYQSPAKILVTGGGIHNSFLMERIRKSGIHEWIELTDDISDFKEAMIFALLGTLRWRNEINVLASVTGSKLNHSGGVIYLPV